MGLAADSACNQAPPATFMQLFRPSRLLGSALLATSVAALAGETGSVSGSVNDDTGGALPDVAVTVLGQQLPAGRKTATTDAGAYHFQRLLPGIYVVSAEVQGIGKASRAVEVLVDRESRIDLVLRGKTDVTLSVVADIVDARSTEVATNVKAREISQLPLPRTYYGLLRLLPAAPVLPNTQGFVPVAGGTRQDNKYLIDGVNITNPGYGYIGIDTNELDVADVNFKTGAISVESGRNPGAVVNAVTRSGTNQFHGGLRVEAAPAALSAPTIDGVEQDVDTYSAAANLGFPILKNHLFGYASFRFGRAKTTNTSTPFGTQPDSKSASEEYFGKLTGYPTESFVLNAGFRALPSHDTDRFDSIYDAPSAAFGSKRTNYAGNVSASWIPTKDATLEAKYIHMTEDDTYQASHLLSSRPTTIDPLDLGQYGAYWDPSRSFGNAGVFPFANWGDIYRRDEIRVTAGQYLDLGPTRHEIRLGGGAEFVAYDNVAVSNGWGIFDDSNTTEVRASYYELQPKQVGRTRTYSAFLQDNVTWNRLSATLGVLATYDDFAQITLDGTRYNFLTVPWGDQVQPRVGLVYNAGLLPGDRLYTSYGIYTGLDLKSTVNSFAPFRIQNDFAFFDKSTGAFEREQINGPTLTKYIPPGLPTPYQEEWVIGYSGQVVRQLAFDLHYQYKNLKNPFEDTPIDPNDYFGLYQAKSFPGARRVYRGVTLGLTKPYANGWQASLTYTYSRLYGNWDEDFATGIYNTSSWLEDVPGWKSAEANRFGRLGMDRPHVLKVFASGDLARFTLGAFLLVQSGLAWQATGADPSGFYMRYLEPAGSRRAPTVTTVDLLGAYTFDLGHGLSLRLEARVANLFDAQTPLAVDTVQYLDPYVDGTPPSTLGPQGTSQPNPTFGMANSWVRPRRFVLTAWMSF